MASSNALTLASSDNPGTVLVTSLLNGNNYNCWSSLMQTALCAKNKLGFVDGTIQKPKEGDPKLEDWGSCNSMIVSWITNSLEKHLQPSVSRIKDAKVLWDELKQRFSRGNKAAVYKVKSEIAMCKQEKLTVDEF